MDRESVCESRGVEYGASREGEEVGASKKVRGVVDGGRGEGKAGGEERGVVRVDKGGECFILELQSLKASSS